MVEETDNDLDFIISLKKNTRETLKVREDFKTFMDANLLDLTKATRQLVDESPLNQIVDRMKTIDLRTTTNAYVARIQFLLNELPEEGVKLYYDYYLVEYSKDALEATWKEMGDRVDDIRKDNPKAVLPEDLIEHYNATKLYTERRKSVLATIRDLLMEGVFGDLTLDDSNMTGVYFHFPSAMDDALVTLFIKEVRRIQSDAISRIQKVTNSVGENGSHVLFFFDNYDDAVTFYSAKEQLESVFDKYLRFSQQNAKVEYNWNIITDRNPLFINANLPHTDPLSGMYVDPNTPVALTENVSLNDVSEEMVEETNEELNTFVSEQYDKVVNVWKKNPERFSVVKNGSDLKLVATADFEDDADFEQNNIGLLSDLYSVIAVTNIREFAISEREKLRRWKKSPSKFSIVRDDTQLKTKETSDLKGTEHVLGTVEDVSNW